MCTWGLIVAVSLIQHLQAASAERCFETHTVNADSTYSAAAVLDVDRDGRSDIVCGGWWYRAPNWERQRVREVEMIRGRYDDYSALPLDVNGDGRLDLISCNYRSESLYWVEQPADASAAWTKHVIDKPGPMETGRLVDINADGQLDVLPNGTGFTAWWKLDRASLSEPSQEPRWLRHDLPSEIAGHGIGCGDVNGDRRMDLVGPDGWLEATPEQPDHPWTFHGEFHLDRDASIPILVTDVDADGDADLIWGRGHSTGLNWLEQRRNGDNSRTWVRHPIDTSWSQPHTLLLADCDGDGINELIAGKRYLGHEGKDLGEFDPLVIYRYTYEPEARTWRRHAVSEGGRVGWDLDPKAADLDGDGDLDLVAPGRSGLYWLENRPVADSSCRKEIGGEPAYEKHSDVMVYLDENGNLLPVRTPEEMGIRRSHILLGMQAAMGPLPDPSRRVPLDMQVRDEVVLDRHIRRHITFAAEAGDRVPAYLLIPKTTQTPRPAMLCLHQTTSIGKDEPAGIGGLATLHYAAELADRGYVCIVPDYPSFGEYAFDFSKQGAGYASGSMKAIWNNIRALDVLETLPEVDRTRIGCIGHSLGGHNSLFTAAFDLRIRAVITSCGFTGFHDYYGGKLDGWTPDRYMPRIRDVYRKDPDRMPFDFHEVLAAIAPRSVFVSAPLNDANFAVDGVVKVVDEVKKVYVLDGAPDRLMATYPACEHSFPDDVRQQAYEWLDRQLR
jgi:dienelactone hydrolase